MINSMTLAGRAGKDFVFKTIGTTLNKAAGSIAYQAKKSDPVTWFTVEIISFGTDPTAQKAAASIKKGDLVLVQGKMICNAFEDKTYWKLEANKFDLLARDDEQKD